MARGDKGQCSSRTERKEIDTSIPKSACRHVAGKIENMSPQPVAIWSEEGDLGELKPELLMHQLLRDSKSGSKGLEHFFQGKKAMCYPQTSLAAAPGTHIQPLRLSTRSVCKGTTGVLDSTTTWSSVELALPWLGHMVLSDGLTPLKSEEQEWPQKRDLWVPRVNQVPWVLPLDSDPAYHSGSPLCS